jgi:hypothetical protein
VQFEQAWRNMGRSALIERRDNLRWHAISKTPVAVNLAWILEEMETKEKVDEYTFDECLSVAIAARTHDDLWL